MNAIFLLLFIAACAWLLVNNPELLLPTLLDGATDAAVLCLALLASYTLWMGLMQVWEDCGISKAIARCLRPLCKKLFRTDDEETVTAISINLSANLLGLGGAATPYGIKAVQLLDKSPNAEYASCMFFALNATSIQLLPTSVVGIRAALGSGSPADIVFPTILCTALSTAIAVCFTYLALGRKHASKPRRFLAKNTKMQGAGTR